jgi:hypothetical protein
MTSQTKPFPWPWLILGLVVIVAGLSAVGGWAMGQRDYPIDEREISGPVAAGAQFTPPHTTAPAVPSEAAVARAVNQMSQESLPAEPVDVTFGHLTSSKRGIDSDVWLVTFPGYCTVSAGTPGGPAPVGIATSLVVVDAATGTIVTTLVNVDWHHRCASGTVGTTVSA